MRKRILMGVAGAALLIVGFVGGMFATGGIPAFAATNTPTSATTAKASAPSNYCQIYLQTLEGDLHISQAQLTQANADAVQKVLDQMQKDGKITAAQKTKIEQRLQTASKDPCAAINAALARKGHYGKAAPQLRAAQQQIETAVAGALKISVPTLQQDLANGQTIQQIAKNQNVPIDTVNTAYMNAVKNALSSAQSSGMITQAQSTALLNKIQQAVNAGHYPGLERHGSMGTATPSAGSTSSTGSTTSFFPAFGM